MRRSVVAVVVLGQFSLTKAARNERQLCGAAGYSRFRPFAGTGMRLVRSRSVEGPNLAGIYGVFDLDLEQHCRTSES